MKATKKLPDSEFEVMKAIWAGDPPLSTNQIIANLDSAKAWKPQTVLTLLTRLIERGYVTSEKAGRERMFFPLISEQEYLEYETGDFIKRFYHNSVTNMINTLYQGKKITESDIDELYRWIKEKG